MRKQRNDRLRPDRGFVKRGHPTGICRLCGAPIDKQQDGARRTFHTICLDHWQITSNPGYVRSKLVERDHEVCGRCGLDCGELKMAVAVLLRGHEGRWSRLRYLAAEPAGQLLRAFLLEHKLIGNRKTFWDAHHHVAVVEGGGGSALDNFETICLWCHAKETAELRKRLAAKRKEQNDVKTTG